MTKVVTAPSTSLDGLIAGADDSPEQRLGSTATDSSAGSATVIRPAGTTSRSRCQPSARPSSTKGSAG
jgi:hypothetical protein